MRSVKTDAHEIYPCAHVAYFYFFECTSLIRFDAPPEWLQQVFVPPGDVLIHAGDLTSTGEVAQLESLDQWMGTLPHQHKIVIAGNHDITVHNEFYEKNWKRFHRAPMDSAKAMVFICLVDWLIAQDFN
jgi:hypothetical protein